MFGRARELAALSAHLGAVGCQFGMGSGRARELAAQSADLGAAGCQFDLLTGVAL